MASLLAESSRQARSLIVDLLAIALFLGFCALVVMAVMWIDRL